MKKYDMNKYKGSNLVQNSNNFFKVIEEFNRYSVKFEKDGTIKAKFLQKVINCGFKYYLIMKMTDNEFKISINNGI